MHHHHRTTRYIDLWRTNRIFLWQIYINERYNLKAYSGKILQPVGMIKYSLKNSLVFRNIMPIDWIHMIRKVIGRILKWEDKKKQLQTEQNATDVSWRAAGRIKANIGRSEGSNTAAPVDSWAEPSRGGRQWQCGDRNRKYQTARQLFSLPH